MPNSTATKAQIEKAMSCITRLGHGKYRNDCDRKVSFYYCYTGTKGVIEGCPRPPLKDGTHENIGYYAYLHDAHPADTFETPFGHVYGIELAVCPGRTDGTFYLAVARKSDKFICRSMLPNITRKKSDAHGHAVRAKAAQRATAQAKLQRDIEEEQQWQREQDLKNAERRRRTAQRRMQTRNEIQRLTGILEELRGTSRPQCKPDVRCSGYGDTECLARMEKYRGLPPC